MLMQAPVSRDITPCGQVYSYQIFKEPATFIFRIVPFSWGILRVEVANSPKTLLPIHKSRWFNIPEE
jgi:hypothetical protein